MRIQNSIESAIIPHPMSLYLKYRPKSFADVVGQEHIVTTLEHAIARNQLVHAYLFFGPRGTGKTSVARILAKILLIQGLADEEAQKRVIKSVDDGTLVDLIEIDAATNRQIDDVRDLKEKVQFAPSLASAKVYIVDEVHMMTKEAFNALLKTLEEPPKHTYFILATTELNKVPDTIQSRCQRFPFHQIGDEDIVRALQNIADKERITIDRGALRALARHVNGGLRDAISLLDQLGSLEKVTEEDVRLRIGESAEEYVEDLWILLNQGDRKAALDIVITLQEKGVSLEVFLRQLLSRARRDLHQKIDKKESIEKTLERIDAIFQALRNLRVSPVPSVALEVAIVDLCMEKGVSKTKKSEKADKVAKVDKATKVGSTAVSAVAEEKLPLRQACLPDRQGYGGQEVEKVIEDATFTAKELTRDSLNEAWGTILSSLKTASIRMSLKDAIVENVGNGEVVLAFSSGFHRDKIKEKKAAHEVESVLKDHFHQLVKLECVLRESEASVEKDQEGSTVNMAEAVVEIFGK